ncbi:MAG: AmmeMemoRadiSam system protein A [Clostridiales Family XIII bacterium]|jgi:AmmeMemoRadiSam system protein A|nr:AmmeMemoRadiSam system protein A [Clostridiales Family XIII bacterium]
MEIVRAFLLPHPPLIVPGVGAGDEIPQTRAAAERVASEVLGLAPDTVIYVTPHSCLYADYIHISPGAEASGDFGKFRAPDVKFEVEYDEQLASLIGEISSADGLPAGALGERDAHLDHGVMVPLYFMDKAWRERAASRAPDASSESGESPRLGADDETSDTGRTSRAPKIVRISVSGFSLLDHYRFGMYIAEAVRRLERRAVLIASGDMSHRLKEDGPYGFAPEGPVHDAYVKECLEDSDLRRLARMDRSVREGAGECGLASILVAAGYLDGRKAGSEVYSYEGPYGVGYLVAALSGGEPAPSLFPLLVSDREAALAEVRAQEDIYVRLARANVESYVRTGRGIELDEFFAGGGAGGGAGGAEADGDARSGAGVAAGGCEQSGAGGGAAREMMAARAGVFVSIKKDGELRGCIGTTEPTCGSVASEILSNSVSAAVRDPRFDPIDESELDSLTYSVDVLAAPEKISGPHELDAKRYGVIVSSGGRRGLLLPDLDGVDTVRQQIDIARRKAGIGKREKIRLERFEVIRHR